MASFVITGTIVSCSQDFLEVPLQGKPTTATDPNLAQNLVTGVYNSLLAGEAFGGSGGDVHGISFVVATNIISDDAEKGSAPADQPIIGTIDNFTHTSTNNFVAALWTGHYSGIAKANQAVEALNIAAIDINAKNQFLGEVVVGLFCDSIRTIWSIFWSNGFPSEY